MFKNIFFALSKVNRAISRLIYKPASDWSICEDLADVANFGILWVPF